MQVTWRTPGDILSGEPCLPGLGRIHRGVDKEWRSHAHSFKQQQPANILPAHPRELITTTTHQIYEKSKQYACVTSSRPSFNLAIITIPRVRCKTASNVTSDLKHVTQSLKHTYHSSTRHTPGIEAGNGRQRFLFPWPIAVCLDDTVPRGHGMPREFPAKQVR